MDQKKRVHADLTTILSHQSEDIISDGRIMKALDVHSPYSKDMRGIFRSRTFKTYKERYNSLIDDTLTINVEEICTSKECARVIKAERLKAFKSRKDGIQTACYFCGEVIYPKIKVRVGTSKGIYDPPTYIEEEVIFYNEEFLRSLINDLFKE